MGLNSFFILRENIFKRAYNKDKLNTMSNMFTFIKNNFPALYEHKFLYSEFLNIRFYF